MMTEQWRDIPRWEGIYQASDLGNIRSLDRIVPTSRGGRKLRGKILTKKIKYTGGKPYHLVRLSYATEQKTQNVARLVYEAFYGEVSPNYFVTHCNDDTLDDRLENLQLISTLAHSRQATLGRDDLIPIRKKALLIQRYTDGETLYKAAKDLDINYQAAYYILEKLSILRKENAVK